MSNSLQKFRSKRGRFLKNRSKKTVFKMPNLWFVGIRWFEQGWFKPSFLGWSQET
jgi:hypothetical protein